MLLRAALALVLLAVAAPVAPAARIPGWDGRGEVAVAVGDDGRGVVAFEREQGVWVTTVAPDGTVGPAAPVPAPPSRDGLDRGLVAAVGSGAIAVAWSAFTGERPAGPDGFGFARRVLAARWTWGEAPPAARVLAGGVVEADLAGLAVRPDGTGALAFSVADSLAPGSAARLALLPPAGDPHVRALAGSGEAEALAGDAAGRLAVAWTAGRRLRIAPVDAAGGLGRPASFPLAQRRLGAGRVLLDARGGAIAAWERLESRDRRGTGHFELRVAARRSGARRFGRAAIAVPARLDGSDFTVARGTGGRAVVGWQRGERQEVRLREPGGRLSRPQVLSARLLQPTEMLSGVDGRGNVLAAFPTVSRAAVIARVARARPGRGFGAAHAVARDCSPVDLAVAPGGRALLVATCDGSGVVLAL